MRVLCPPVSFEAIVKRVREKWSERIQTKYGYSERIFVANYEKNFDAVDVVIASNGWPEPSGSVGLHLCARCLEGLEYQTKCTCESESLYLLDSKELKQIDEILLRENSDSANQLHETIKGITVVP